MYNYLTSSMALLNVVVVISIPFLLSTLLLYSVSSTVFTVFVELPSTKPNDEVADLPWFDDDVNLDAKLIFKQVFFFCCAGCQKNQKRNLIFNIKYKTNMNIVYLIIICSYVHWSRSSSMYPFSSCLVNFPI